jgi:hypothetical protein
MKTASVLAAVMSSRWFLLAFFDLCSTSTYARRRKTSPAQQLKRHINMPRVTYADVF